jgi:hypothetical protein
MKRMVQVAGAVLVVLGAVVAYRYYMVSSLRGPVMAEMVDPESAQFRGERYFGPWTVSGGILCGQVNAKNRMGGYVGFKYFSGNANGALISEFGEDAECEALREGSIVPWWWLRW